jgi:hypothetical protein
MGGPEYAATQVLARGGSSLHGLVQQLSAAGSVTNAGLNDEARRALEQWLGAHGEAISHEQPPDTVFPFGFLDDENSRRFLHGQYEKAKEGLDSGYEDPRRMPRAEVPRATVTALDELLTRKHRLKPVHVTARIPPEAAGMGAEWIDAWLLRALLERHPDQADNVLSVTEAFAADSGVIADGVPWFGQTVAGVIAWDPGGLPAGGESEPVGARVPGFDITVPRTVQVRIELPAGVFPNPAGRLAEFLRDAHAPVTLTRRGDTESFVVPGKSAKKKLLLAGTCRSADAGAVLELSVGTRPFLGQWLASFGDPDAVRDAVVEIVRI